MRQVTEILTGGRFRCSHHYAASLVLAGVIFAPALPTGLTCAYVSLTER